MFDETDFLNTTQLRVLYEVVQYNYYIGEDLLQTVVF
jgi:hypothetical protein